jgi:hypothetical protein
LRLDVRQTRVLELKTERKETVAELNGRSKMRRLLLIRGSRVIRRFMIPDFEKGASRRAFHSVPRSWDWEW